MTTIILLFSLWFSAPANVPACEPPCVRQRYVEIFPAALDKKRVGLNLFGDANYIGIIERAGEDSGGYVWSGRLWGIRLSSFTIARVDDVYNVHVNAPGINFTVEYFGGIYRIQDFSNGYFTRHLVLPK